jgi:deoxyribodipyrimidine photo-lyase
MAAILRAMPTPYAAGLMWYRRDLRAHDNAALHHALRACDAVHAAFVFDRAILDPLPRADRRVDFIRDSVAALDAQLRGLGGPGRGLIVAHEDATQAIPRLAGALGVQAVFANHDDDPAALARDARVRERLAGLGIALHTFKDHVVFERGELRTQAGQPYSVFTPYARAWLARLDEADLAPFAGGPLAQRLAPRPPEWQHPVPSLADLGFAPTNLRATGVLPGADGAELTLAAFLERIDRYDAERDRPALAATSGLGVHLRFGTVPIRRLVREARSRSGAGAATWLKELVWREFYQQVLANFPQVGRGASFRPAYDRIAWETGPQADRHFAAWCAGRTGYPLVDAAMRQLNATGFMHNRLRMVAASFLCKDLGLDWRWGERYFAQQLVDYELASNNGGWQWASSSGCDAQPWFRIFNPVTQGMKFDPQGEFILRYLPELAKLPPALRHAPWDARPVDLAAAGVALDRTYPRPIVVHATAREVTLARYAVVKA